MDEKKRMILTILGGFVSVFFIFTNFCRPLIADNIERAKVYKQLKAEVQMLAGLNEEALTSMENQLKMSISQLEEKFYPKGELKFVQKLTSSAKGLDISFADISRRGSNQREGYEEFPVSVVMKASFNDLLRYLLAIEQNPLIIGISSLDIRKGQLQSPILDINITFLGFSLLLVPTPFTKYIEEKYKPIDSRRLEVLSKPFRAADNQGVVSRLLSYDPFNYDLGKSEGKEQTVKRQSVGARPESLIGIFSLQGILNVQNDKAALINDTVVKEGEVVGEAEVVAIEDYKVILRYLGKDYILTMGIDDAFTD